MGHTLESFAAQCKELLSNEPGPAGREKVVALLRDVLSDGELPNALISADTPERDIVYEDGDLGFCIVAHNYQAPKDSSPHDHGPSWAIYGQAGGETMMNDWEKVADPQGEAPGKAKLIKTYKLTPGMAHLYNEGDMHSPSRDGPTQLIRIEGTNMDKVSRDKFEPIDS